jgi:pimeloyl-ACP methyl ester carboxylesterase
MLRRSAKDPTKASERFAIAWQRDPNRTNPAAMILTLTCVVALLAALPFLVTSLAYLGRRSVLSRHDQPRRRNESVHTPLPAFLRECAATAFVMAAWPLRPGRGTEAGKPLAILLPDAGQSGGAFLLLGRRLRRRGWDCIVGATHATPRRLDEAVERLDLRIRSLAGAHPVMTLIGHGSGGLLARAYALDRDGRRVRQIITLGTPHRGTEAAHARLACFRALAPESPLIERLGLQVDAPGSPERIAIYSEFDAWVVPVEGAYDPGALNIQVRGVGHFSLITSRRVFELLAENLTSVRGRRERLQSDPR